MCNILSIGRAKCVCDASLCDVSSEIYYSDDS